MNDVRPGAEPQNQVDEWGTVAGGLPSHESLAERFGGSSGVGPGTATFPNGARPAVFPVLDVPAELLDHPRYRVVESLGKGGMGAVYRAEHRIMKRAVALKVIAAHLVSHPAAVERFRREVEAAARLNHPHIVTAYDAEQAGACHFLVMELVDGVSLNRLVEQTGPFPVGRACECARQAALGLEHAHAHGMVHRDIKPHNLMRTRDGQVKILDFGLTRFADDASPEAPLTHWSILTGTPDYIAPEQAANAHRADIRADIYGLGCTLYYLLTGRPPFPEGGAFEKVAAHLNQSPRPASDLRRDLPAELSAVLERMMAKDPRCRYQTPMDVAKALRSFCKDPALTDPAEEGTPLPAALLDSRTNEGFPASLGMSGTVSTGPSGRISRPQVDRRGDSEVATVPAAHLEEPARNPSRLSSALTVGLVVFVGCGVGGAFGLLPLFRANPAPGGSDRARVVVRSKSAASPAVPAPDTADDAPMVLPNLDASAIPRPGAAGRPYQGNGGATSNSAASPAPGAQSASPRRKPDDASKPVATSSKSAADPPARGQVVVRSKDPNLEVAIRRGSIVVMTLRPSMGAKELPAGTYDVLVVGGPQPLQGMTSKLSLARGDRMTVDVRPDGILVGDAASLPPPPPQHPDGPPPPRPPPPFPGPRRK